MNKAESDGWAYGAPAPVRTAEPGEAGLGARMGGRTGRHWQPIGQERLAAGDEKVALISRGLMSQRKHTEQALHPVGGGIRRKRTSGPVFIGPVSRGDPGTSGSYGITRNRKLELDHGDEDSGYARSAGGNTDDHA